MLGGAVSMEDRRAKLQPLVDSFNSLTQRFVWLCLDRGRLGILPNAFSAFRARRMQEDGVLEGVVEAPRPLGEHDVKALENSLQSRLGKTVRLAQAITPDLVGGVRVTIGDKMIDASIAGRFDDLRRRLLEARLPSPVASD
jgi:F-type H+-transporting ATPase subunit delta